MSELPDPVPGARLPSAPGRAALPPGIRVVHTSQSRRGRGSCSSDRGRRRAGPAPGGGREAIPSAGAWRRDTPAQRPRRGAAIRVGGSFSSRRCGHLGAARGSSCPRGAQGALGCCAGHSRGGAAGPAIPQDLGTPWTEAWPRHPARFCSLEAENRCVSQPSPPQLPSAGIQPPSCRPRRAPAPEGWGVCAAAGKAPRTDPASPERTGRCLRTPQGAVRRRGSDAGVCCAGFPDPRRRPLSLSRALTAHPPSVLGLIPSILCSNFCAEDF